MRTCWSSGAPGRIRTSGPRIRSPPLCPLSYRRMCCIGAGRGQCNGKFASAGSRRTLPVQTDCKHQLDNAAPRASAAGSSMRLERAGRYPW